LPSRRRFHCTAAAAAAASTTPTRRRRRRRRIPERRPRAATPTEVGTSRRGRRHRRHCADGQTARPALLPNRRRALAPAPRPMRDGRAGPF
jgi:hypothetical protein